MEAGFDGGTITSDAGALFLGATDRVVGLVGRLAGSFVDARRPDLIEHDVATLIGQRVFGIALGYGTSTNMSISAMTRRWRCWPASSRRGARIALRWRKSTLNRLELSRPEPTRYHKIAHDEAAIERLFVELFLEAHANPPKQIVLDLDATDDPVHGHQEGRFFHGYYDGDCYLPLYVFCGRHLLAASSGAPPSMPRRGRSRRSSGSLPGSGPAGRGCASCFGPTRASPARPLTLPFHRSEVLPS